MADDNSKNPQTFVGILDEARDEVAIVINPGEANEQRIVYSPLVAVGLATEVIKYAKKLLRRQKDAVARHATNTENVVKFPAASRSRRFDS